MAPEMGLNFWTHMNLDLLFYRIDLGYTLYETPIGVFKVTSPSKDLRYRSELFFEKKMNECSDLLDQTELYEVSLKFNWWTLEEEAELFELDDEIETLQIALFENFYGKVKQTRLDIRKRRDRKEQLLSKKNLFSHFSKEGYSTFAKSQFILENTVYLDDRPYDFSGLSLMHFFSFVNDNRIQDDDIRKLARSEPWTSIKINRKNSVIFPNETDEQRRLLIYDNLYTSIREYQDCPSDEIISDNDAFEGWLALKRRENNKTSDRRYYDSKLGKNANKQEVFIPASTIEEARKIDGLNSKQAMATKQRRLSLVDQQGNVEIQHMPDVMEKART